MLTQVVEKTEEPGNSISNSGKSLPSPGQRGTKGEGRFVEPTGSAGQMEFSESIGCGGGGKRGGGGSWKSNLA